ncbi:Ras-related protein Rab-32 [Armadillidium vulgare]|nr:Ras-related protein Rab-32 [Armadillidium vulgare]
MKISSIQTSEELQFKVLVVGEYGVGKTAVIRRYTEGQFSLNYKVTIGVDFAVKTFDWDSKTKLNIQLW